MHRQRSAVAAVQHRPALDAELRGARPGGGAHAADRRDGVRGSAERRLLRRSRRDLRPRRPPAVPAPAPAPLGGRGQRRPARHAERAHDRDPGPDRRADEERQEADRPVEPALGARHLGRGEPPVGAGARPLPRCQRQRTAQHRFLGAGLAARQPALQRGRRPARQEGPVERDTAERRRGVRAVREAARAREAPARAVPGRLPEPRCAHRRSRRPGRDPADGHPARGRARFPELHGPDARGHAAPERRDPAGLEPEARSD